MGVTDVTDRNRVSLSRSLQIFTLPLEFSRRLKSNDLNPRDEAEWLFPCCGNSSGHRAEAHEMLRTPGMSGTLWNSTS